MLACHSSFFLLHLFLFNCFYFYLFFFRFASPLSLFTSQGHIVMPFFFLTSEMRTHSVALFWSLCMLGPLPAQRTGVRIRPPTRKRTRPVRGQIAQVGKAKGAEARAKQGPSSMVTVRSHDDESIPSFQFQVVLSGPKGGVWCFD
ncbi:hypothetical protein HDV57DRAFT_331140 [Trichoderma longibrachiatum]